MTSIREIINSWGIPQNFKNTLMYSMDDPQKGGWDIDEEPDADFHNLTDSHLQDLGITAVRFRIRILRYVRGRALALQQKQMQQQAAKEITQNVPRAAPSAGSARVPREDNDIEYEQPRQSRSLPDKTDRNVVNNITVSESRPQYSQAPQQGYAPSYPPPSGAYGPGHRPGYGGYGGGYGVAPVVEIIEPMPAMGFGLGGGLLGAEMLGMEAGLGMGLLAEEAILL